MCDAAQFLYNHQASGRAGKTRGVGAPGKFPVILRGWALSAALEKLLNINATVIQNGISESPKWVIADTAWSSYAVKVLSIYCHWVHKSILILVC